MKNLFSTLPVAIVKRSGMQVIVFHVVCSEPQNMLLAMMNIQDINSETFISFGHHKSFP